MLQKVVNGQEQFLPAGIGEMTNKEIGGSGNSRVFLISYKECIGSFSVIGR
jgi:hypothetical protein